MRPPRKMLIVGEDDDKISPTRFVLSVTPYTERNGFYQITTKSHVVDALEAMKTKKFDVCMIFEPLAKINEFCNVCHNVNRDMKIVIVARKYPTIYEYAHAYLDPINHSMRDLIQCIRELSKKKRGPNKEWKISPRPELFTLEERKTA